MINTLQSFPLFPAMPDTAHLTGPAQLPCSPARPALTECCQWGLTTTQTCCLTELGTRSLKLRCPQGVLPLASVGESSSLPLPGCWWGPAQLGLPLRHFTLCPGIAWPSLLAHAHVSLFAFLRRTPVLLDLTHCDLTLTNYVCKDTVS